MVPAQDSAWQLSKGSVSLGYCDYVSLDITAVFDGGWDAGNIAWGWPEHQHSMSTSVPYQSR